MEAEEAVILTRRAYEADAAVWAARGLGRDYAQPRLEEFAAAVNRAGLGRLPVLDLGCGPGFDSDDLVRLGLGVVGLDITRAMLDLSASRRHERKDLVQGDSRFLPLAAAGFGGAWASASLLHLPKVQAPAALAEVARAVAAGGMFYSAMKEGDRDRLDDPTPGAAIKSARHFAHYRRDEWTRLVTAAGFDVLSQDIDRDQRDGYPDWIVTLAARR
ncbi:MAG TPA: class I SAM-dependent methyltransferase [Dehalococcoidia bacterium]|jgi:SAM-dependent methyltransferase